MSREATRNIPALIRQRLLDKSRSDGRSTMDIDLLGKIENVEGTIRDAVREIFAISAPENGIGFDPTTIGTSLISEDADYHGIRVAFQAGLDSARIKIKLDIGFGDVVYPRPERMPFPTILALPSAELLCYSRESVIAEKYQTMAKLGSMNSRMKDFFDIWLLSRRFDFKARTLREALRLTFEKRGTDLVVLTIFTSAFALSKQVQWKAFRSRMKLDYAPEQFSDVLKQLSCFLDPLGDSEHEKNMADVKWIAPGPWRCKGEI